jgi:hypothetical protein
MTGRIGQWTPKVRDVEVMARLRSGALDPEGDEFCVLRRRPRGG